MAFEGLCAMISSILELNVRWHQLNLTTILPNDFLEFRGCFIVKNMSVGAYDICGFPLRQDYMISMNQVINLLGLERLYIDIAPIQFCGNHYVLVFTCKGDRKTSHLASVNTPS